MKRLLIIFAILVWPVTAYGALLPQPTGSCPKICFKWNTELSGKPVTCAQGSEKQMVCNKGRCVADKQTEPVEDDVPCNYTLDDILQSAVNFITLILGFSGSLALLMLAYGGFQMFTSMGNPEGINKAKSTIIGAFLGLILILGAVAFVQFGGIIVGGNVKPTGEVEFGTAPCEGKNDNDPCGNDTSMSCWKGACISSCEFKAATDKNFYGYTCQPLVGQLKGDKTYIDGKEQQFCQYLDVHMCPGDENKSVGCCITATRAKAVEEIKKVGK